MLQAFPKSAKKYMSFISIAGTMLITLVACTVPKGQWPYQSMVFFAILLSIVELLPVNFSGKSTNFSISFPISYATVILVGPIQGSITLLIGFIAANIILHGREIRDIYLFFLFNCANMGISLFLCGVVFNLIVYGVHPYVFWKAPNLQLMGLISIAFGAITYFVINSGIGVMAGAFVESKPFRIMLISNISLMWPSYVVLTPFAVLIAFLYAKVGMWTVLPFFIPFMAARQCVSLYSRQIQAYTDCVTMLVSMTQRYHPYTREHLEAVAMWSERLAYQLHLPTRKIMAIRMAGELHDIGKIGVGEVILDKQERLSDEDWQVIRSHPTDGARILEKMKYFDEMVPWIRSHHERLDGKGYPDGLTGDEIPYEARIISVADSFHAMISKERRYRTPMTLDEVKTELQRGAGTQWDPDVVAAMLTLLEAH